MKKRIAFVVQRYGIEVNGGAEYHCRLVAERLTDIYDVDVLTSCAKDYSTWRNEYTGNEIINGIQVMRFPVPFVRNSRKFRSLSRVFSNSKPHLKVLRFLGLLKIYQKLVPLRAVEQDNYNWAKFQGPYVPGLLDYLKKEEGKYDALIFFTYLYYPTIYGLDINPEKSILIPTAHDEPPIYFPVFKNLFTKPKAILYNTVAEQRFVNKQFNNKQVYSDIVGIGVEKTQPTIKYNSSDIIKGGAPYLIYIGRIDESKGCKIMCNYFLKYKQECDIDIKLVLVGQAFMKIPENDSIINMGFVDEDIKLSLLEGAKALIIPSFYESLSMVTLESMVRGIPVIANGDCEVLKDHIELSKAGFIFENYESFKIAVNSLFDGSQDLETLSQNAKDYVSKNYNWRVVIEKIKKAVDFVSG